MFLSEGFSDRPEQFTVTMVTWSEDGVSYRTMHKSWYHFSKYLSQKRIKRSIFWGQKNIEMPWKQKCSSFQNDHKKSFILWGPAMARRWSGRSTNGCYITPKPFCFPPLEQNVWVNMDSETRPEGLQLQMEQLIFSRNISNFRALWSTWLKCHGLL